MAELILYVTICFRDGKQLFDFLTENYGVINNIFAIFNIGLYFWLCRTIILHILKSHINLACEQKKNYLFCYVLEV